MSDETTPQDDAAMSPASTGSVASGWSEELVSVVADYRIEWRQPEGRQDALELLMRSAGGGGGMGGGHHGPYSATAVGKPRLSQPTLTDAEREAVERACCSLGGVVDMSAECSKWDAEARETLLSMLERLK